MAFRRTGRGNRGLSVLATCSCSATELVSRTNIGTVLINSSLKVIILKCRSALSIAVRSVVRRDTTITHNVGSALLVASVPFVSCRASICSTIIGTKHLVGRNHTRTIGLRNNGRIYPRVGTVMSTSVPIYTRLNLAPRSIGTFNKFGMRKGNRTTTRGLLSSTHTIRRTKTFTIILRYIPRTLTAGVARDVRVPAVKVNTNTKYSKRMLICRSVLTVCSGVGPGFIGRFTRINRRVHRTFHACGRRITTKAFPTTRRAFGVSRAILSGLCWSVPARSFTVFLSGGGGAGLR